MEGTSFLTSRSIGFRPSHNDSVLPLANNCNQKSLTPICDRFKGLLKEREEDIRVSSGRHDEIEIPSPSSEEIVELYEIVLSELTINSKPLITDLTIIAGEQREHGGGIADAICARIIEVPVEQKLPSLYLLDSIVKNIGRDYVRHFSARLPEVYCLAYRQIHPNMHPSMRHLFGTWSTVFPSSVLCKIEAQLQFSPSASHQSSGLKASESPRPAHGIHVNPKYLEARRQFENSTTDSKIQQARATSTSEILEQPSSGFDEYESDSREALSSHTGSRKLDLSSNVGRNPFSLGHARPPSPSLDEFALDDSPKKVVEGTSSSHEYGRRPHGMAVKDEDLRDWQRPQQSDGALPQIETTASHCISNGFDIQRPRALIDAYGTDERNKTTNPKLQHTKNLITNGLGGKSAGQTWQNTEEEEFEWENMSPTLVDRGPATDPAPGAYRANQSTFAKTDLSRGNWSNQELIHSVAPNHAVSSSDHGLKRKISGFHNEPSDNPVSHYPQESWNLSHDQPWATLHHYNPRGQRPPLIDSFPRANAHHLLSLTPRMNSSSVNMMNPEVSIPSSKGSWRSSLNMQTSQPVPPFKKHIRSQFDMLKTGNSAANENVSFLHQPFDVNENRVPNQLPQMHSQQAGLVSNQQRPKFPPHLSLPQEVRSNMVPPALAFNPSHTTIQPMFRGYTPQRFDTSGGASMNPVHGMQSSMPFLGVGFPPLPPGPPPSSFPLKQIPQFPPSVAPTPPAGGALSGLFSSLVAQGLLSLTKPSSEQACVGLEFDPDVLKTRHESAITALYADLPRQCKTCGLRFKLQEEHSNHMDWHVTKNRVSKNHKQKPSRKWFPNASMWLSGTEASGADAVPGFLNPSENVVEKKDDEDMAVPADEDQNVCALCGEAFDDFYSDETEEWMYRGAVYMNAPTGSVLGMDRSQLGPIVHSKCRSESAVAPPDDFGNNGRVCIREHTRS
ncbi:polyadenylation and cleavage factor homolog 4-like [Cynara cardunculus var. scolymus]|uniref:polyadenylation and cleavage factor homolog 4-like n=1 Tax=Cynara cardunculus var. scolymus TaxID=59895 RepID=UPI000D62841B|nr:polyadenylation and cleavage factor homolog 4-like [Cynara cardunculus var. scolymus]XP_024988472.1 polyadenylation and cleavage factor homolog 4-like [Cynara cardunculus var. scolymus]